MIESVCELIGEVDTDYEELTGEASIQTIEIQPVLQEKEVDPIKEVQIVKPDEGYNGLSQVTVNPIVINYQEKEVTPTKETQIVIPDEDYDALSQVHVKPIPDEYIILNDLKINDATYLFSYDSRLNVMNEFVNMISDECTRFSYMFYSCGDLINAPNINTKNCTNSGYMFGSCEKVVSIPMLDFGNNTSLLYMFNGCKELVNLGGFKDLGKAYKSIKKSNNNNAKLDLSSSSKLTHDSLMNVINNLYDLNVTYDVVNGGTLYNQSLVLGSTNMAKLTAAEIEIATNKGWTVS